MNIFRTSRDYSPNFPPLNVLINVLDYEDFLVSVFILLVILEEKKKKRKGKRKRKKEEREIEIEGFYIILI